MFLLLAGPALWACSVREEIQPNAPDRDYEVAGGVPATERDDDGDGYPGATDCDDGNPNIAPGVSETCDEVDQDCDGLIDDDPIDGYLWYHDTDADGYGDPNDARFFCTPPKDYSYRGQDCDDGDPAVNPEGVELCNGVDDDCDGVTDGGGKWYRDADGDGFGYLGIWTDYCDGESGYVRTTTDCDDADASVNPDASDLTCDGVDNDCNRTIDNGPWYADADGDSYGDPDAALVVCTPASVLNARDCDDTDANRRPDREETADGTDEDCDLRVDEHLTTTTCEDATVPFDWFVPDDAATIQGAIDGSVSGERICVRAGTYNEVLDFGGRDVLVYGEGGAGATTIDAAGIGGAVVTLINGESAAASLQGFTLVGGTGYLDADAFVGDEIDYCSGSSAPNYVSLWCGAGLYIKGASPTLADLVIESPSVPEYGQTSGTNESGYPIYFTTIGMGAGVCIRDSTTTLQNVDVNAGAAYEGGAAYIDSDSVITWSQSYLTENVASYGGAIFVDGGDLTLENIVLSTNTANYGSSIYANAGSVLINQATIFADIGSYSSVELYSAVELRGLIVSHYSGYAGVSIGSYDTNVVAIENTLVWSTVGMPWYSSTWPAASDGNISADPAFTLASVDVSAANDLLTLQPGSPAIDAGDPTVLDQDGSLSDIGAFGGAGALW